MSSAGALQMAEALSAERPGTTLELLKARARRSRLVAESLADYVAERASLEDAYVRGLSKLQRRPLIAESYGLELGSGLERLRRRLETELEETLRLREQYAAKLNKEVADVLRERGRADEASLKQHDAAVTPTVRDHGDLETRVHRLEGKAGPGGGRKGNEAAAKLAAAQQDLARAQHDWRTSHAPQLFAAYDAADRARIEAIKESLARFATMANDAGREAMDAAARVLNDVFAWELDEDVGEWLRTHQVADGRGVDRAPAQPTAPAGALGHVATTTTASSIAAAAAVEPAPSIRSVRPERAAAGFFGKLKPSLGRQRSSSRADAYGSLDTDGRAAGRVESASLYSLDVPVEGPTPLGRSMADRDLPTGGANAVASATTEREERRRSFMPSMLRRKNSSARDHASRNDGADARPSVASDGLLAPPGPIAPNAHVAAPVPDRAVDADGYTVPPSGHDRSIVDGSLPTGSLMDDDDNGDNGDAERHNRAGSFAIQARVAQDDSSSRKAAMDRVQSALLSSAPQGSIARRGTARDRRAVRSGIFTSAGDPVPLAVPTSVPEVGPSASAARASPAAETVPAAGAQGVAGADAIPAGAFGGSPFNSPLRAAASDAAAVRPERADSVLSMSSSSRMTAANGVAASALFRQPDAPGLHIAVSENLQIVVRAGSVERAVVTGEVAMLLRGPHADALRLRIAAGSGTLAKSAPNAAFLRPVQGSPDIFELHASALATATVVAPAAVYRYQIALADATPAPLQVSVQWKCEPTQTSILVSYEPSAATQTSTGEAVHDDPPPLLGDLNLQVPITSATVGAVQTKPTGAYVGAARQLRFRLADLELAPSEQHKVLARLAVGESSEAQPVTMQWTQSGMLASALRIELDDASGAVQIAEVVRSAKTRQIVS